MAKRQGVSRKRLSSRLLTGCIALAGIFMMLCLGAACKTDSTTPTPYYPPLWAIGNGATGLGSFEFFDKDDLTTPITEALEDTIIIVKAIPDDSNTIELENDELILSLGTQMTGTPIAKNTDGDFEFVMPDNHVTVRGAFVSFATYTLTFSAGANGSVTATVAGQAVTSPYLYARGGASVVVTAAPDTADYIIREFTATPALASGTWNQTGNVFSFTMPANAVEIAASFRLATLPSHNVTITNTTPSFGTISVNGSTTSPVSIQEDSQVTITLTANTGYRYLADSLYLTGMGIAPPPVNKTGANVWTSTFTMAEGITPTAFDIAAAFEAIPTGAITITVSAEAGFTVDGILDGATLSQAAAPVAIDLLNMTGFNSAEWWLNGDDAAIGASYTLVVSALRLGDNSLTVIVMGSNGHEYSRKFDFTVIP